MRALAGPLPALLLAAVLGAGAAAAGEPAVAEPAAEAPEPSREDLSASPPLVETEIVGFLLQGSRVWERLTIPDLDVVPTDGGRRLLPLLRLLEALRWETVVRDRRVSIQPDGAAAIVLDLERRELTNNGESRPLEVLEAVSDVTQKREIFLPPEQIAQILGLEITWDQENYAYLARTKRALAIWEIKKGMSLFSIRTEEITGTLPEAHPAAGPRPRLLSLDFVRLQGRAQWKAVDEHAAGSLVADSLEQTLWGDLLKGRYKVRVGESALTWDGSQWEGADPAVRLPWAELEYRHGLSQAVIGDSVFGLSDLIFPSARIAGLRFNGLLGGDARLAESDRSGRGASLNFNRPLQVSGRARVGSKVSLSVNGLVVETVEILNSLPEEAGVGLYIFDAIQVAPGSLNEIRIAIVDPDGVETIVEKKIVGSSSLMPRGAFAFLGGVGTNRDLDRWDARGLFAGTRFFHGLGQRATVGATVAYQQDYFDPQTGVSGGSGERPYPVSSGHAGAQLVWQPFDLALLSGDFSWSNSEYAGPAAASTGFAWRVNADLLPARGLQLHGQYFFYEPDFFDGQNRNLRDRQGVVLHGGISPLAGLELVAAAARVEDNVRGASGETRAVDLQRAALATRVVPRSSITLAFDRLAPDWGDEPRQLASIDLHSAPLPGWSLAGYYSTGDDVTLGQNGDFLDGLRLPVFSLAETRHAAASLSRDLPWGGSLQLQYRSANREERISLVHAAGTLFGATLLLRTEIGRDLDGDELFFEHRAEYPLPGLGGSRLQLQARHERDVWSVAVSFSLLEVYRSDALPPRRVHGARFDPETGCISGSVFIDVNANAVRDPGEPGLGMVKVSIDGLRSAETDDRGAFLFPLMSGLKSGRIFVDASELPATYVCTHCLQQYRAEPGRLVAVHFGVTPAHSVSGRLSARDPGGGGDFPLPGVRVTIAGGEADSSPATSVTAGDGSYYFGNVLPGACTVRVDPRSVPEGYRFPGGEKQVVLRPALEPQELSDVDFVAERIDEAPVAEAVRVRTEIGTPVPVTLAARDKELRPLVFRITDYPANGTLSGTAPQLTYVPNPGFQGEDAFTYVASDGVSDSAPARASITVRPPNNAPAATDDGAGTDAGVPVTVPVLENDTDPDADPLRVTMVAPAAHGTATSDGAAVTYTPDAGYFGGDAFTYTVEDGRGGAARATVRIIVVAAAPRMHVANIAKWLVREGEGIYAKVRVTVVDGAGTPVPGATVTGSWSVAATAAAAAVTNARGAAVLTSPRIAAISGTKFVFTVTGLARDGWVHDAWADLERSDAIWTP